MVAVTMHYYIEVAVDHAVDSVYWTNAATSLCSCITKCLRVPPSFHCLTSHWKSGLHLKSEFVTSASRENTMDDAYPALPRLVVLTIHN